MIELISICFCAFRKDAGLQLVFFISETQTNHSLFCLILSPYGWFYRQSCLRTTVCNNTFSLFQSVTKNEHYSFTRPPVIPHLYDCLFFCGTYYIGNQTVLVPFDFHSKGKIQWKSNGTKTEPKIEPEKR